MAKWSKMTEEEKSIFLEHFENTTYEEISNMLPNRTEMEIISMARKLDLRRDEKLDRINIYYDKERQGWVKENKDTLVSSVFPSKEGQTYEEARQKVVKNMARVFNDLSDKYYPDFLKKNNLPHHPKFHEIYWKVTVGKFTGESTDHLLEEINEVIKEINSEIDKKGNQKDG